ncbi:MAG: NAD(P)(+) transhydrogenase (Re/Si-specific) subunit beta [Fibrobacteria bacterium]|nr:NAD(P)(+) transhydrogenase (Re/Si-specific) subunit beta [Fibrobacteria bacterium]
MNIEYLKIIVYAISTLLFVFGLKMLGKTHLARRGNMLSSLGMLLAILVTLIGNGFDYKWIAGGMIVGTLAGVLVARLIVMTRMPEMVALLNGFGGISSLLLGWAVYVETPALDTFTAATVFLSVLIGGITFTGSLMAWGKLGEFISGKPFLFSGQMFINGIFLGVPLVAGLLFVLHPDSGTLYFYIIIVAALLLGITSVLPIGGADMPVVISLMNSYSGLAAAAAGFAVNNILLIVAGSLVGASGIILTNIMCKSMNRTLINVLFSGFGAAPGGGEGEGEIEGTVKPINADDAYLILESASSVVIVPGYGLAVAQAQHAVRELGDVLEENGAEVRYAIHPVAGRMPGHMNVLLAEASVPYDQLYEMDAINPVMESVDVAIVIGANDVVNPAARENESSPIYGMPIINVDKAKTVFVLKRSMAAGFAGIQNSLFYKENTRMLFGDAKESVQNLVGAFKD